MDFNLRKLHGVLYGKSFPDPDRLVSGATREEQRWIFQRCRWLVPSNHCSPMKSGSRTKFAPDGVKTVGIPKFGRFGRTRRLLPSRPRRLVLSFQEGWHTPNRPWKLPRRVLDVTVMSVNRQSLLGEFASFLPAAWTPRWGMSPLHPIQEM